MTNKTHLSTVSGLIEFRGRIIAARIPVALLIMDTLSFALTRIEQLSLEGLDPDYTSDERAQKTKRADALNQWVSSGCRRAVDFDVDVTLYVRSAFHPAVVTQHDFDAYVQAILNVSTVGIMEALDSPTFAIHSSDGEAELWLTDHRALRAARLHSGEIRIIETSSDDLKTFIASQQENRSAMTIAMPA